MNKALSILKNYKKPVWREIKKYLKDPEYADVFVPPSKYKLLVDKHWRLVREYPERQGKYLRPTLVLLTADAMAKDVKKAYKTAAAMQISEDWLLIHDDFQDGSIERRGKPTLHRIYGSGLAVNAGDHLHMIMWKILMDNYDILGSKKTLHIMDEFYTTLSRTALGQSIELIWANENKLNLTDNDYYFIVDGKTAYYTIVLPLRLGAIIAGANKRQIDSLTRFGKVLGRSFQIVDDVLDLTTDFEGLKKQKGNDIYEGKRTIVLGHLLRTARPRDWQRIVRIMAKPREKKTESEVSWMLEKMEEYGSIDYSKGVAAKLNQEALSIFDKDLGFLKHQPARSNLRLLVEFILTRHH